MSSQSGITASDALVTSFHEFVASPDRAMILEIDQSELAIHISETVPSTGSLHADLDKVASDILSDTKCAYVIFRTDVKSGDKFAFVSYVPDNAPVKSKMLYASTKNTLLRALGTQYFDPILFANSVDELTGDGWRQTQESLNTAAPLTESEISLQNVMTASTATTVASRGKLVSDNTTTLLFQLDSDLESSLAEAKNSTNKILTIAISEETLQLVTSNTISSDSEITSHISNTASSFPAYHVYSNESGAKFFILSCPSGSKVRERMLYASSKQGLLSHLKEQGWEFAKVFEIGDADELDVSDLHPSTSVDSASAHTTPTSGLRFAKPKGPRRR